MIMFEVCAKLYLKERKLLYNKHMNATITLRDYIKKGKVFSIPNYQRGYVWGKKTSKA